MALRNIRKYEDEILRKKCRKVDAVTDRIKQLIEDMKETMYDADGVGLAAPQVGILKQIVVVDVGEGPIALINPVVFEESGSEIDEEGCLSIPGKQGKVERPAKVKVKAMNDLGNEIVLEGEGLLARAICHEVDHLNGILFIDKIIPEESEEE